MASSKMPLLVEENHSWIRECSCIWPRSQLSWAFMSSPSTAGEGHGDCRGRWFLLLRRIQRLGGRPPSFIVGAGNRRLEKGGIECRLPGAGDVPRAGGPLAPGRPGCECTAAAVHGRAEQKALDKRHQADQRERSNGCSRSAAVRTWSWRRRQNC